MESAALMPEISRFFGIVIAMYYNDHEPPHFHAYHGGLAVTVRIDTGQVEGRVPTQVRGLIAQWYTLHRDELMANWVRSRERRALLPIRPLE